MCIRDSLYAYPFDNMKVQGLAGKVEYAQFLHDGSEVKFTDGTVEPVSYTHLDVYKRQGRGSGSWGLWWFMTAPSQSDCSTASAMHRSFWSIRCV